MLLLVAFFASGAAGLLYEVAWIRRSSLAFGSTTLALSSVLAVFFLGLALGSAFFGRIAGRMRNPVRTFAGLELGLAAIGLASLLTFDAAEVAYGVVYRSLEGTEASALLGATRLALIAALLLPPTFLMGGTLPLLCKHFVVSSGQEGRTIGGLYAWNTAGAAAGCLLGGLAAIPWLGLAGAIGCAAVTNGVAALAALIAARSSAPAQAPGPSAPRPATGDGDDDSRSTGVALAIAFASGLVALGMEVLWARYLSLHFAYTVLTYTATLAAVLIGIVLGSALAAFFVDRIRDLSWVLGGLLTLHGVVSLSTLLLPPSFWSAWSPGRIGLCVALLGPPAVLQGAVFPLCARLLVATPDRAASGAGGLLAANTLGGILGSLAVGFLGVPWVGMHGMLLMLTALQLYIGMAAWLRLGAERSMLRVSACAVAGIVWLVIPVVLPTRLPADYLGAREELLGFIEGRAGNVAVLKRGGLRVMEIDLVWQGADLMNHQALAAHVPMILHPAPERVLVIGVGAGQAPSRFLMYDIDRLDCVDIEPAVFQMVDYYFPNDWMRDPRVRLLAEDGRNHLVHTADRFDVVSIEVGQPTRSGVPYFYTADFYEAARAHLRPGGVVSQFVPLQFLEPAQLRDVVATFTATFPEALLWYNRAELLLLGRAGPWQIAADQLERLSIPAVHADLDYAHWGGAAHRLHDPAVFLGSQLGDPSGLARLAKGGRILRDVRPRLDYGIEDGVFQRGLERETAPLIADVLDTPLALPGIDRGRVSRVRSANLRDLVAGAERRLAMAAPPRSAARLAGLQRAVRTNPQSFFGQRALGIDLLERGRRAEGIRALEQAGAIRPEDLDIALLLARAKQSSR